MSSGYQKLPSGLIIQWGHTTVNGVIFPIAFPNAVLNATATKGVLENTSAMATAETAVEHVTLTGMGIGAHNMDVGNVINHGVLWMAIGH